MCEIEAIPLTPDKGELPLKVFYNNSKNGEEPKDEPVQPIPDELAQMVDDLPNDLVPATGLLVHLQIPNIEPKATDKENGVVTFEEVPNGWVGVIVEDCRFEIEANACDPSPKMICLPFPPPPDLDFESEGYIACLLYTSPSPRDRTRSRMPSSA